MSSCPFALVILALLSAALPASAKASTCGDPPPVADDVLEGEIKGKAQFLSRFLGDVALGGRIQSARTEIFSRYPDAERSRSNAYFEYQICILLMNDDTLTNTQKIDKLMEIRRVRIHRSLARAKSGCTRNRLITSGRDLTEGT